MKRRAGLAVALVLMGCDGETSSPGVGSPHSAFDGDVAFLSVHTEIIVLSDASSAQRVAVAPAWQGRVMTSTAGGPSGASYGWVNRPAIRRGIKPEDQREGLDRHIHVFGGEDRFWIGPEGGQFSWYFEPGAEFTFENWLVPAFIDTAPWEVARRSSAAVTFTHTATLENWSGRTFAIAVEREVRLLDKPALSAALSFDLPADVSFVAFESLNRLSNAGAEPWTTETGLPSVWILGMLIHGDETTVAIPYRKLEGEADEPIVKDDYFGKVPGDRLIVDEDDAQIYFTADGKYRSKIGIGPKRSLGAAGSWDALRGVLTIVQYNAPPEIEPYVNSQWALQDDPYRGDAINSYNDGPIEGGQLGPFYELETSSPALALGPGASYEHIHRTIHFEGERDALDAISRHVLGVSLGRIERRGGFEHQDK